MYNSKLERHYIKRFCITHFQGPMIHVRFSLPDDDIFSLYTLSHLENDREICVCSSGKCVLSSV